MIQILTAVQFTRFMSSGRTSPALCTCEDEGGSTVGEYVVKLRGSLQHRGLLSELLGARLASHFGLSSPTPALITLQAPLIDLVADLVPSKAEIIKASTGLNFGTQVLIGFSTWPVDKQIPESMRESAAEIFAFDALLQNPDRRHGNPNLLTRGDTIAVFDHEIAFSFLLDIFPSLTPWNLASQAHLMEHVFYRQLKSQRIDLTRFTERLTDLSEAALNEILVDVPVEWNNENAASILRHLLAVRNHAEEFAEEVRRFLA